MMVLTPFKLDLKENSMQTIDLNCRSCKNITLGPAYNLVHKNVLVITGTHCI